VVLEAAKGFERLEQRVPVIEADDETDVHAILLEMVD